MRNVVGLSVAIAVIGCFCSATGFASTIQVGSEALVIEAEAYDYVEGRFVVVDNSNPPEIVTAPPDSAPRDVLPAGSPASGGAALYSNTTGTTGRARYDVQFATDGTYYGYVRYTLFNTSNQNGANDNSYGNEDSVFFSRTLNALPTTSANLDTVALGSGGYNPRNNPLEGLEYLWLPMRYNVGNEKNGVREVHYFIDDGVSTGGEASIGDTVQLWMQWREGGATPDVFVFSTDSGLTNDQLEALVNVAPEPSSLSLSLAAVGAWALWIIRRRRRKA